MAYRPSIDVELTAVGHISFRFCSLGVLQSPGVSLCLCAMLATCWRALVLPVGVQPLAGGQEREKAGF
jgi:hypothetical protein